MWIPPENTNPIVFHAPTRKSIGIYGVVRIKDGRLITDEKNMFDANTFLSFLKKLSRYRRKGSKMVVVLDNARWHHAKLLKNWLTKRKQVFQLEFLPPYSPELNPIERVWKLTRRLCTHNQYFQNLEDMTKIVFNQFESWYKPNDTLRRLCAII